MFLCLVGVLVAGCGSAQVAATPVRDTTGVAASCAALSPGEQFDMARTVFVGVMLPGPATQAGVLASPARMRVERYLKGHGPRVVRVNTAVTIESDATGIEEDGIEPRAGQRWKIYTQSRRQPFDTSICLGNTRLVASPALALWRAFPVQATPRPIVPLGEGLVLDPATGFHNDAQKFAYMEGHFVLRTLLPGSVGNFGRFTEVSANDAYRRLRGESRQSGVNTPPLIITGVHIGTATFVTDRGPMRLPAWRFFFKGVADPAFVLAVGRSDLFIPPRLHRFAKPGPGSSIEDSATISPAGTAITLSFDGPPPGTGPCQADYRASAVADRRAVAFAIATVAAPVPPGTVCDALAVRRSVVLHVERPLGARVLISASDGGAVPVTPAP
ncbi:MAG: hypothetical protein ACTHMY_21755 [Solirubrobacteraceae bacterium]